MKWLIKRVENSTVTRFKIFKKIRMENERDMRIKFPCGDEEGIDPCCLNFSVAKHLVGKIFGGVSRRKSHSCDNLLVL